MSDYEEKTDAQAIIDAVERLHSPMPVTLHEDAVAVVPAGMTLQDLKPYIDARRARPERKKGFAELTSLQSFIDHWGRHHNVHSVVFADDNADAPSLLAVYDYNEPGGSGLPRFGEYGSRYCFPISDEWKVWTNQGNYIQQKEFAEFLEDRLVDVLDPAAVGETVKAFAEGLSVDLASPAKLIELSRGLTVHVGQRVAEHRNLSSGEVQVAFEESHSDKKGDPLRIPGAFAVGIPVFRNGPKYQVPVRLRYRVHGGVTAWACIPHRTDLVFQHAIDEAVETVKSETEAAVFYGRPECR